MSIPVARSIALLISILFVTGCSIKPASSGDLDLRTGCAWAVAERSMTSTQVVMDVRASDCRDSNGLLLERGLAVDRIAEAVWQTLGLPVDVVRVTVSEAGASREDASTTITGDELAERFGPGPSGAVWPVSDRADESIWVVLPVAHFAAGLAMLLLVRRLRGAGLVVVLLRR